MDFLAFWMALGAMVIAILAAWFAKRQADAAEHANRMAVEANRLANETYRGMAFRWEIIQDTTMLFRLMNTGLASAWNVRIWLPNHMNGERKGQAGGEMAPLTYISFSAFPKLAGRWHRPHQDSMGRPYRNHARRTRSHDFVAVRQVHGEMGWKALSLAAFFRPN